MNFPNRNGPIRTILQKAFNNVFLTRVYQADTIKLFVLIYIITSSKFPCSYLSCNKKF